MKKTIAVITLILAFILSGNAGAQNNLEAYIALPGINVTHIDGIDYVHREQKLHVKLGSLDYLPDFERFLEAMNASISRPFNRLNWGVIKLEENVDLKMAIGILKDHQLVEYAEPLVVAFAGSLPNDPDIHMQWYIRNTGQSPTNGTPGASAHFANAWMLTTGSSNVAVGVLDTGIAMQNGQLSHPDLQNTSRIIPRLNLVDPNDPEGLRDTDGHGTFVAGIIGAEANNQVGIAGVSPDSKLLIYKTSKMTDAGHLQDALIDLHDWATTTGDRVILNYSYGTQTPTQGLFDAVEYSSQNEILLVTITHNIVRFNEITYPAKYADQFSNVLAVGGTNKNDLQDVGITGPEVTIAAPAGTIDGCTDTSGIFSTMPNYNVTMNESASGDPWDCAHNMHFSFSVDTSYAAPQVAGAAALLLSMDSTLTP
jgi:subtilisin family serine protease